MPERISPNEAEARQQNRVQPNGNGGQYDDVMSDVCNLQGIRSPRQTNLKVVGDALAPCCVFPGTVVFLDLAQQFAGYPATLNCQSNPPEANSQLDHSSQDPSPEQQQEADQRQQLRQDTTLHGAAIGQTGTSTRQELTAWIRVLAIPCRSCYATDSASMMKKALKLIAAAEWDMEENAKGIKIRRGNPFKKPWGCKPMETFGNKHGMPF